MYYYRPSSTPLVGARPFRSNKKYATLFCCGSSLIFVVLNLYHSTTPLVTITDTNSIGRQAWVAGVARRTTSTATVTGNTNHSTRTSLYGTQQRQLQQQDNVDGVEQQRRHDFIVSSNTTSTATEASSSSFLPALSSNKTTTVALLYPPGLLGGYRNQVIRFVSLNLYTRQQEKKQQQQHQLLLPSLLWSTKVAARRALSLSTTTNDTQPQQQQSQNTHHMYPIPMDWIFDIPYWNAYASGTAHPQDSNPQQARVLPKIVNEVIGDSDCWVGNEDYYRSFVASNSNNGTLPPLQPLHPLQKASLLQGTLRPLANITRDIITRPVQINTMRRTDYSSYTTQCRNPVTYGGGRGAGVLWNQYMAIQRTTASDEARDLRETERHVFLALRPKQQWRQLAKQCLGQHHRAVAVGSSSSSIQTTNENTDNNYIALHARVELEMFGHKCGLEMEKNLTKILLRTAAVAANYSIPHLFVAVHRDGIADQQSDVNNYNRYKVLAEENLDVYNRAMTSRQLKTAVSNIDVASSRNKNIDDVVDLSVFECGEQLLTDYYSAHPDVPDHGTLLQSAINFDLAVNAKVFVGVQKSSFSTDVWKTRYYRGQGSTNYRYTQHGIEPVDGGFPPPHRNCSPPKKKKR